MLNIYCLTCTGRQGGEEEECVGFGIRNLQQVCSSTAFGSCLGQGHVIKGDEHASSSYPPSSQACAKEFPCTGQQLRVASHGHRGSRCQNWGCSGSPKHTGWGNNGDRYCYTPGEHIDLLQSKQSPSSSEETMSHGSSTCLLQRHQKM